MGASSGFIVALNQDWKHKEDSTEGAQEYLDLGLERSDLCEIISLWIMFSSQNLLLHVLQSVFLTLPHTVTTLCRTSFNVPFSGMLTKKGDCIPLQHLQIVVIYLFANMEAQGNAFINSTSPKTTRCNPVHVAQPSRIGVKLLSFTNTAKKNLRDSRRRDNIEQKVNTASNAALQWPACCVLITLKFSCTEAKWETKLLMPSDQLSWFLSGTRHACHFLFEIPSMLDNQKYSPHLPSSPTALQQQRRMRFASGPPTAEIEKPQRSRKLFLSVFAFWSEHPGL